MIDFLFAKVSQRETRFLPQRLSPPPATDIWPDDTGMSSHVAHWRACVCVSVCVCHTEKVALTKQFVSAAGFLGWDSAQSVRGSRTPTVEVLSHWTVEAGNPAGHFLNVPSWCAHVASRLVGNKGGLVNSQNRSGGEQGGSRATIFDHVCEGEANETRSKASQWLWTSTFRHLLSITKHLQCWSSQLRELTQLEDVW